ncbi:MAG: sigma-70 family RNA polymerase sigma factor [Clostridia bacterium]|nr:sigma-70 family RNA polymerase sigma factor [Clostridia bacterium]MBQ4351640.1 sigma-70 family RNA polymerase sigma factor [Clostridia bacterium]
MQEREIVSMFLARNEDAIGEAEAACGRYCRVIAKNITGSDEDAEKCVSDALLAAWNSIPPARPESLRGYLGKLTRNIALDRWEKARAKKRGGGEVDAVLDELEDVFGAVESAEDEALRHALTEAVNAFLGSLEEERRAMFVRRYWYAESVGQIAGRFGIRENTAAQILRRIRKKLKDYLTREGFTV